VGKGLLPTWSPDGKKILYTAIGPGPLGEPRLTIMDADGQNVRKLVPLPAMMGQQLEGVDNRRRYGPPGWRGSSRVRGGPSASVKCQNLPGKTAFCDGERGKGVGLLRFSFAGANRAG
jgi:hypothetical protein